MAIFGFKKTSGDPDKPGATNGEDARAEALPYEVHAEKARKFFQHARTVHETTNYEYAMKLWLDGLRQDPASMEGLEGFFESAKYFASENKKGPSKETAKSFGGRGDVEKYLAALLDSGAYPLDSVAVVRAADCAARLGLAEITYALAERAMVVLARDPRGRKDLYLKLMDVCGQVNAFDLAVRAGEAACRLDPSDGRLASEVRNLAAQATMSRGGYDKSGQAGGFRSNIRDADKQRMLEEQ